jgi:hypothetical protein
LISCDCFYEFDPARTVVPPLDGLNVRELCSAMVAVDAELRTGGVGGPLLVESLASILSVHLIRHITGVHRLPAAQATLLNRKNRLQVIGKSLDELHGRDHRY